VGDGYGTNGKRSLGHVERRIALHLEPVFGGWRMGSINTPAIRTYIEGRQKDGAAIASVNRELAILKRAFKLALQDGRMLGMPHIPMLQESNARSGSSRRSSSWRFVTVCPGGYRAWSRSPT
jgi:hypothetical protein